MQKSVRGITHHRINFHTVGEEIIRKVGNATSSDAPSDTNDDKSFIQHLLEHFS